MTYGRWLTAAIAPALLLSLVPPAVAVPPVDHVHSSSRYDRSPASLSRVAHRFAATAATVITWTEVSNDARARQLRVPHWRVYSPERTDVAVSWVGTTWKTHATSVRTLSRFHFTTLGGHRSITQRAAVAVLDRRADKLRALVVAVHLPARKFSSPARARVWRTSLAELHALVPIWRHRWSPDLVIVAGDWNADPRTIARRFPSLRLTWRGVPPSVNGTLTNGRGYARLLAPTPSSDHRPYRERLDNPAPRVVASCQTCEPPPGATALPATRP